MPQPRLLMPFREPALLRGVLCMTDGLFLSGWSSSHTGWLIVLLLILAIVYGKPGGRGRC